MKIETYQSIPGDPRWRELFASSGENNYFATERWYENFLATVATDPNTIQLVGATSPEGIPVAMFPLWQPGRSWMVYTGPSRGPCKLLHLSLRAPAAP